MAHSETDGGGEGEEEKEGKKEGREERRKEEKEEAMLCDLHYQTVYSIYWYCLPLLFSHL
jgi:hypothetical protein